MAVPIASQFCRDLVKQRWGSVDQMALGWRESIAEGQMAESEAKDRASIYRWLARGLPNKAGDIFGFCAMLDVDPLVLVDIESQDFRDAIPRERALFLANLSALSRISSLWPLVKPAVHWPDAAISNDYYRRTWSTFRFDHKADTHANCAAHIRLRLVDGEAEEYAHRVFYFAWRRQGSPDQHWRPYGILRKRGRDTMIATEAGDMNIGEDNRPGTSRVGPNGEIDVETWFGPNPAEFKIACLHPFTAQVTAPSRARNALTFPG